MKHYKGFNKDMQCRGFQYEEGKTYETDTAKLCNAGFHACECPLDVFGYYSPTDDEGNLQKFHEVELDDISNERDGDSKVCAKKITIGAELNFLGLAKAHVEWVKSQVKTDNGTAAEEKDYSAATNTGDYSAATNTGDCSAASNTGYRSAASNTGNRSAASNTGNRSAASNTGYRSAATNTGDYSAATNTGNCSAATNTGDYSIAVAWGAKSKARAALGSYIVVAEYDEAGDFIGAKMGKVDGKRLKANVYYTLCNGKFVKAEED